MSPLLLAWLIAVNAMALETVPDRAVFSPLVIHVVRNIGEVPLRGIVIELTKAAGAKHEARLEARALKRARACG